MTIPSRSFRTAALALALSAVDLTVHLDTGRMIAVVQDDDGDPFRTGDRIRALSDGYRTRIAR